MDLQLLNAKIDSLNRCILRINAKCPETSDGLSNDLDAQDIIAINRERAIHLCVDMAMHILSNEMTPPPQTMAEAFLSLHKAEYISEEVANAMVGAVGFRNIAVHAYRKIDWDVVFNIATTRLDDFRTFVKEIYR